VQGVLSADGGREEAEISGLSEMLRLGQVFSP